MKLKRQVIKSLLLGETEVKVKKSKIKKAKKLAKKTGLVLQLRGDNHYYLLLPNTSEEFRKFKTRQKDIYNNKVKHNFNITNMYQEVRYILEEMSELMRAIEKSDNDNLLEELSDIVIFAYGLAEISKEGSLDDKIFEKMEINKRRIYNQNADGDFEKIGNKVSLKK